MIVAPHRAHDPIDTLPCAVQWAMIVAPHRAHDPIDTLGPHGMSCVLTHLRVVGSRAERYMQDASNLVAPST